MFVVSIRNFYLTHLEIYISLISRLDILLIITTIYQIYCKSIYYEFTIPLQIDFMITERLLVSYCRLMS